MQELTAECKNRPCMVIDDGWQTERVGVLGSYNGGPWFGNERYGDMRDLAEEIQKRNARAGLWFRSLQTKDATLQETVLFKGKTDVILDPSHPYILETVKKEAAKFYSWGYEIIKHDFSVYDCLGLVPSVEHTYRLCAENRSFFDKTKTTATVLKELYQAIQDGAKGADVIACGAISHLSAGIHSICRVGSDTSGRSYEWTKRQGVNSMMRLPLNNRFYRADPDCAVFSEQVDEEINLDFLEMCAYTGAVTLASAIPYSLSKKGAERMREIYKIADSANYALGIDNYHKTSEPEVFMSADGKTVKNFNWTKPYNGSRIVYGWME